MNDEIEHAVFEQIFRSLESLGQAFSNRVLDDSRPSEADQRTGFCDGYVPKHRVGRGNAACGGVRQNRDIWEARLANVIHRDRGSRHLHQGKNSLLHPRTAGGGDHDKWSASGHGFFSRLDQCFPDGRAHRPAHKSKILSRDHYFHTTEPAN